MLTRWVLFSDTVSKLLTLPLWARVRIRRASPCHCATLTCSDCFTGAAAGQVNECASSQLFPHLHVGAEPRRKPLNMDPLRLELAC